MTIIGYSEIYEGFYFGDGSHQPTNWKLGELIARGRVTNVYHVINYDDFKINSFVVKQAIISDDVNSSDLKQIDVEIKTLKRMDHPRIVDYHGFSRTNKTLSLFIQYMNKGSLARFIASKEGGHLSEKETAHFTHQILEGLAYLHENRIIHRDIKGSNILMQDEHNIKIADFGVAKLLNTLSCATTQGVGTSNWMAPELFQEVPYTSKVDIWSLGCTVYQMITGTIPFKHLTERLILIKANKDELELIVPEHLSPGFKQFLQIVCEKDPDKRPEAKSLLDFNFFPKSDIFVNIKFPYQTTHFNLNLNTLICFGTSRDKETGVVSVNEVKHELVHTLGPYSGDISKLQLNIRNDRVGDTTMKDEDAIDIYADDLASCDYLEIMLT